MTEISATLVKTLRDRTGAGVILCRKMLIETKGDLDAAVERLRDQEAAVVAKRADRVAAEGLVGVMADGRAGAIVELNVETDFVARSDVFREATSALTRVAALTGGDPEALLGVPAPDGDGTVANLLARLSARTGERVSLRRSARVSVSSGTIASYVHNAAASGVGRIGVLVAIESAAPPEALAPIGRALAMHVAASAPVWVATEDVPEATVAEKRAELLAQAGKSGKPAAVVEKIVDGRLRKYYDEVVLRRQAFILDPEQTVAQAIESAEAAVGTAMTIRAFVRFKVGEGLEPAVSDAG